MKRYVFVLSGLFLYLNLPAQIALQIKSNGYAGNYFINTPTSGTPFNGNKDTAFTEGDNYINFGETAVSFSVNSNGVVASSVNPSSAFSISADSNIITFNTVPVTIKVGSNYTGYYCPSFFQNGKQYVKGQQTYSLVKSVTYMIDNGSFILNSTLFFYLDGNGVLTKASPNHSSSFDINGSIITLKSTSCKLNYNQRVKIGCYKNKIFNVGDSVFLINSLATPILNSTTGLVIDTIYP